MKKRKCFTCDGRGYFYLDGEKIICPNCTANKKEMKK